VDAVSPRVTSRTRTFEITVDGRVTVLYTAPASWEMTSVLGTFRNLDRHMAESSGGRVVEVYPKNAATLEIKEHDQRRRPGDL